MSVGGPAAVLDPIDSVFDAPPRVTNMSEDDYSATRADSTNLASGKHRGPRFSWNSAYEETFFRSLCESVNLGLREGTIFKSEAWDRAARALGEKHQAYANKSHLINKSDNARKKFRLWRGLVEDPEFFYNPLTKTVTASEEVWKRHIEREPLSRSLKTRPFEHEEFYQILFPDVIGSGGAPKRVTRPRRKTDSVAPGDDQDDGQHGGIGDMDVLGYESGAIPLAPQPRQLAIHAPPVPVPVQPRPSPAAMPRTSINTACALTPPDENVAHTLKRFPPNDATAAGGNAANKRMRTGATGYTSAQATGSHSGPMVPAAPMTSVTSGSIPTAAGAGASGMQQPSSSMQSVLSFAVDALQAATDALREVAAARSNWPEQALDIFFRDFSNEEADLQGKIAEKYLTDESKAMLFCKMSLEVRQNWVKRLREAYNRVDNRSA